MLNGEHKQAMKELKDPHRSRGARALLLATVRDVTDMPEELWKAIWQSAVRDMGSDSVGSRRSGRSHLLQMRNMGIEAALALDKIERLDSGEDTDRSSLTIRYADEQANRWGELHG